MKDICEVASLVPATTTSNEVNRNEVKVEGYKQGDEKESKESPNIPSSANDDNQLICFGGNNTGTEEKLDGLTLDDLNGK